jgi:hypothetical protein
VISGSVDDVAGAETYQNEKGFKNIKKMTRTLMVVCLHTLTNNLNHAWQQTLEVFLVNYALVPSRVKRG